MDEYISRETALKIIDSYGDTISEDGRVVYQAIRDIVEFICPSADVVEVVHGEWKNSKAVVGINAETMEFEIRDTDRCSICDMDFIATRPRYKYCPNCGAKMDGDKNG